MRKKIIFFLIAFSQNLQNLNHQSYFKDEICSFHGVPIENNNKINCICFEGYENIKNEKRKINDNIIQCNHEKKKRSITLFFSIFIPIGFDYLYLEKYYAFIIIFILSLFIIFGVFYHLIHFELEKNQDKDDKFSLKKDFNYNKKYRNFFFILGAIYFFVYIINIFFIAFGFIKDGYNVETLNDFLYLF